MEPQVWIDTAVPRQVGQERIVLHAFAGHRKLSDFQWYLEAMMQPISGVILHVVSLDTIHRPSLWRSCSPWHLGILV